MISSIREKRAEKLWDKAQVLLADGAYEDALNIAKLLERDHYSGAYDIGAQALAGLGQMDDAIAMLERGVEIAPWAWSNWELLGNYRSDRGMYESAARAYESALQCADVWTDSIRLNQAVLAKRTGDYAGAHRYADLIEDPELELEKISVKAGAFLNMQQPAAAIELCDAADIPDEPSDVECACLAHMCATYARAMLQVGEPAEEVREFLLKSLDNYPESESLLTCFRELKNEPSATGRVYEVVISFEVNARTQHELGVLGFVRAGHAIADTPEEAVALFCELETDVPLVFDGPPDVELADEEEDSLKGVIQRSDKEYYTSHD